MIPPVETIWQTFNPRLERFVRSRVSDATSADDVLQEVYIKIHTHISSLRDDERLQAWVYQIARNAIHDYYRSQRPLLELPETLPDPVTDDDEADDPVTARLAESVRAMIAFLPEEYAEALLLTEIDGLTQKELAERLNLSLSGAKSRVQRGRKMLREMLLACCHFQFDRLGKVIDYYPRCQSCAADECGH